MPVVACKWELERINKVNRTGIKGRADSPFFADSIKIYRFSMKKETVIIFTKYLLDFMYFAGIVVTVLLPFPGLLQRLMDLFDFHDFEGRYMEIIVIYFVLGILAVLILGELRKMFRTVLNDDCFVKDNVVSLQRMGTYSFVIAVICLLRTVLYMTIAMLVLVLVFIIAGLFSKVLAFVFDKAVEYKLENDLTI